MDLFVLDNSLRESTLGQIVGHNLEDKMAILKAVKSVGIQNKASCLTIPAETHAT